MLVDGKKNVSLQKPWAVIWTDGGASATRKNIYALIEGNKDVNIYGLDINTNYIENLNKLTFKKF